MSDMQHTILPVGLLASGLQVVLSATIGVEISRSVLFRRREPLLKSVTS